MYIKIIGALLVLVGCGGCGILMATFHRREVAALHQLVHTVDVMISELEYRLTPLPELCRFASTQSKGVISAFFLMLADAMDKQISPDISCCTVSVLKRMENMPSHASAQLQSLGQTLGRFDLTGQLSALEHCRKACIAQLEVLEHQQGQRLRSYQTLGFCAGAALAILLF